MEGVGADISQKIRSAIKAKLMEIGVYVDEELPDYIMVMVSNKRSKEQMDEELQLFLKNHTNLFTTWLHQVLQKLQEITVASLGGGTKRKSSDDSKKKKKSKHESEKKDVKKKIKVEPDEDSQNKEKSTAEEILNKQNKVTDEITDTRSDVEESSAKDKADTVSEIKETAGASTSDKSIDDTCPTTSKQQKPDRVSVKDSESNSSVKSCQADDIDDEDCINIRTDGELLDTADDTNAEETSRKLKGASSSKKSRHNKTSESGTTTISDLNSDSHKTKSKSLDDRHSKNLKEINRKSPSPQKILPKSNEKVVDARELLNRKKAAKNSDSKSRKSNERSVSPSYKRKEASKETNTSKRIRRDSDTRRRDDERPHRGGDRDSHSHTSRRRESERLPYRVGTDRSTSRRRDSSNEPPSKRLMLERPRNKKDEDWDSVRSSKISHSRTSETESAKKRDPQKVGSMLSRVIPRPQEPEEAVDTPVPSVVKVTPRPRRPASQQPTGNLIMKAISEANKSLANVPPRPDSTQRGRKGPVFTRTLRQLKKIPPEKIAVSITNPLALQNVSVDNPSTNKENKGSSSPMYDESARNKSPTADLAEVTSSEPEIYTVKGSPVKRWEEEQNNEQETADDIQENNCELEVKTESELGEDQTETEELSDPQFVVTLNGYDPDGIFSHSEMDLAEEDDDWYKENTNQDPLQTSTPVTDSSPHHKSSPIVIMNTPPVTHSNLIEVEITKTKNPERCKFWPACRLEDKCAYYHPTKSCKMFPACKFGDSCLYIHPQCKYNTLCTRKDCVFAHTLPHTPSQPAAMPKAKTLYAASAPLPCKFYPNCTNINCQFSHPARACRFGLYCTKKDCSYDHGQVAPVDKLKWTRVPTT